MITTPRQRVYVSRTDLPGPLRNLSRQMGRELAAARAAKRIRADELAVVVGFKALRSILDVERGRNLTRASRLEPWCQILGIEVDSFLQRYADVLTD